MWWAIFLGMLLIAALGGALALVAAGLPRVLSRWEGRESKRGPEAAAATRSPAVEWAPTPPALAPAPASQEPEAALVAAAIALALNFYQAEAEPAPVFASSSGGASPWALAGRWQAMQARRQLPKR